MHLLRRPPLLIKALLSFSAIAVLTLLGCNHLLPTTSAMDTQAGPTMAIDAFDLSSPTLSDNEVLLLRDGYATLSAMVQAIQGAQHHIHLETYRFDHDAAGQRLARALIERRQRGVAVRVIRDSVGTQDTPARLFEAMQAHGIEVLVFEPATVPSAGDAAPALAVAQPRGQSHRRLLVVDGHTAIVGGVHISSLYSGGSFSRATRVRPGGTSTWPDTDLQLRGPVVANLQRHFVRSWHTQGGPPLVQTPLFPSPVHAGDASVRILSSAPGEPINPVFPTLLKALEAAQTSICLTNAHFVPDAQLVAALQAAAKRGVAVDLILPGESDAWLVLAAGRAHYQSLLGAGVRIHERRGTVLHSRAVLVDGVWAAVGSTNLDWRREPRHHEINTVVHGARFGAQLQALFDRDLANATQVDRMQWEKRPMDQRMRERLAMAWAYWL